MRVEEAEFPLEEIKHYCQIATTLKKTIEVQEGIDDLYLDIEKETLASKKVKVNCQPNCK